MKRVFGRIAVPLFFIFLTLILFWQFFIKGAAPFPGNYMLAWYEPWKSDNLLNGRIIIPHKPVAHDVFRQLYPFKLLGMEDIKSLKLPLWNPYNGDGMPLFATMHMGYLNPLNLIFFILSPTLAWSLQVIIQPLLIGLATYYYCRSLKLSKLGSLFAGVSFMFSGFIITRSIYNDYNFAIIWMILTLVIIEKYFSGVKRIIYFLPFLVFLIICSTQPQIIIYCLLFVVSYFVFQLWNSNLKNSKSYLFNFVILFILGIGLASIQVLPTLELYRLSNLTLESSKFIMDRFLLPIAHLFSLFIPNYFGNVATYNYWGSGDYIESIASIGLIPCFFAYLALRDKQFYLKGVRFFYLATIVVTIVLSLKSPLTSLIYSLPIPIVSTGIPSRIFMLTAFSISVLAGMGLSKAFKIKFNKELLVRTLSFLLIPLGILVFTLILLLTHADCNNPVITTCRSIALRNTLLEVFIFLFGFAAYIGLVKTNKNNTKNWAAISIIFLVSIVGLYNAQKFLPFSPESSFKPNNDLLDQIIKITKGSRVSGLAEANINTDFATLYRYYDDNYYDPLYIKRYGEFVAYANGTQLKRSDVEVNSDVNLSPKKQLARTRLFELTSTQYLVYKNNDNKESRDVVFRNDKWTVVANHALPRAYMVSQYDIQRDDEKILSTLFDQKFDPYQTVVLEEKPKKTYGAKQNFSAPMIAHYNNDSITIKTNANKDALLVLTDNFYPGWDAFVNGNYTKILRANYTFRAIEVPAGNNNVEFRYEPGSLFEGFIVSFISFGGAVGFFLKRGSFTG